MTRPDMAQHDDEGDLTPRLGWKDFARLVALWSAWSGLCIAAGWFARGAM